MAFGRYKGAARGSKAAFPVIECLLHFWVHVRAGMVVTGSSVDQVCVVNKGIAYKRNDGTGESRKVRTMLIMGALMTAQPVGAALLP